ncbi:ATP-binding cassette domain-containing protein [Gracilinema caldarium]|mgnify:FL=1|jgi:ABC-2 type transport system ATP-binding protein|uniref:ATP-binding cassette domain-containing protein n=1 Tax=Gracilinema caldarium TaxID=215591 RepID=UPI0016AEB35E|nr:ATP-binding cassette domain-containing protein [Gracilinema caldarium]NLJ09444.1 ATP-binding cassette domain-containing protein [Treponema sp.]
MLEVKNLNFGYGKQQLFKQLSLSVQPGQIVGLLGLNGAGKTSLLKLIAGALYPQGGEITLYGRSTGHRHPDVLADIYFVPEDPWGPALTPEAWLDRFGVFRPAMNRSLFYSLLEEFQVDKGKLISRMSYGQRKKCALAQAMASGSRLILLDEPTNGLDIPSKAQFRRSLSMLDLQETMFVISTHQARDLETVLDPILIIHEGALLCKFPAAVVHERFSVRRVESLQGLPVVYAEQGALGYQALLAEPGAGADLEMLFTAAIHNPDAFRKALEKQGENIPQEIL